MDRESDSKQGWKKKLGILFHPRNLAKTFVSAVPYAGGPLAELQNQLQQHGVSTSITALTSQDAELAARLDQLEGTKRREHNSGPDWTIVAAAASRRSVDIMVVYDGGIEAASRKGRELFKAVAHGCLVRKDQFVTSAEALTISRDVAAYQRGGLKAVIGQAWYEFSVDPVDSTTGLAICRLTNRDEAKWAHVVEHYTQMGLRDYITEPLEDLVSCLVTPAVGRQVCFVHAGEAENVVRLGAFTALQCDTSTISHIQNPTENSFLTFVTAVLPGRILRSGSGVFAGDSSLLGIIADTVSYTGDAGRRAVVRSLIGHPEFKWKSTSR